MLDEERSKAASRHDSEFLELVVEEAPKENHRNCASEADEIGVTGFTAVHIIK